MVPATLLQGESDPERRWDVHEATSAIDVSFSQPCWFSREGNFVHACAPPPHTPHLGHLTMSGDFWLSQLGDGALLAFSR